MRSLQKLPSPSATIQPAAVWVSTKLFYWLFKAGDPRMTRLLQGTRKLDRRQRNILNELLNNELIYLMKWALLTKVFLSSQLLRAKGCLLPLKYIKHPPIDAASGCCWYIRKQEPRPWVFWLVSFIFRFTKSPG